MQFYDPTNQQGICQEIDRLCDTDDTSYTRLAKTSRVNNSLEYIVGKLINADGTWQFDDTNYTNLPIGTTNLTATNAYSFTDNFLDIEEVSVLTLAGIYKRIVPFDPSDVGMSFEEYFNVVSGVAPSGFPEYYDKQANFIRLSATPTSSFCTLTAGLRVRFKRTANLFTASSAITADTTVPGFASPWHVILAYMASLPYCMSYKKDRVALYEKKVGDTIPPSGMLKELIGHYASREKDKRKVMTIAPINFI